MGANTREALHAGEMGAYTHGVLVLYGCLLGECMVLRGEPSRAVACTMYMRYHRLDAG